MLESMSHKTAVFVTLTYDEENEPENGFLSPEDLNHFLRTLRHRIKFRYYAAGEYGTQSFRPHYHLILFGDFKVEVKNNHFHVPQVSESWTKGFVHIGEFNARTAAYITKYTLKNRWSKYDLDMAGLPPEFQRMSLKPGIGGLMADTISENLMTSSGSAILAKLGDVPGRIKNDGRNLPVARYLQRRIRKNLGREEQMPQAKVLQLSHKRDTTAPEQRRHVRAHHQLVADRRLTKAQKRKKL